jgi:hypothetical protein
MLLQSAQNPAHAFKIPRAGLELAWGFLRRRAVLVGGEAVEQVVAPVQHAHVRIEEFVP